MSAAASGGGSATFWRAAGMTYVSYANSCAALLRKCLKEPFKTQAQNRERVHYKVTKFVGDVAEKPVVRGEEMGT